MRVEGAQKSIRLRYKLFALKRAHQPVHLVQQRPYSLVRFHRRVTELDTHAIELIKHQARLQSFLPRLSQHRVRLHAHPLHDVHDDQAPVAQPRRRRHFAAKIHVSRRIDHRYQHSLDDFFAALVAVALFLARRPRRVQQRDPRALHRDPSSLFVLVKVHVPHLSRLLLRYEPVVRHERVRERRLAVIDVREHAHVSALRAVVARESQRVQRFHGVVHRDAVRARSSDAPSSPRLSALRSPLSALGLGLAAVCRPRARAFVSAPVARASRRPRFAVSHFFTH